MGGVLREGEAMTTDEAWRCIHGVCDHLDACEGVSAWGNDLREAILTIRRADVARIMSIEPPREAWEIRADIDAFLRELEK